jgi:hypothetical protein
MNPYLRRMTITRTTSAIKTSTARIDHVMKKMNRLNMPIDARMIANSPFDSEVEVEVKIVDETSIVGLTVVPLSLRSLRGPGAAAPVVPLYPAVWPTLASALSYPLRAAAELAPAWTLAFSSAVISCVEKGFGLLISSAVRFSRNPERRKDIISLFIDAIIEQQTRIV